MAKGYTGQSMASAMKAKIMETPPMENRTRSDIAYPLTAVIFDASGSGRVQRESRNAAPSVRSAEALSRVGKGGKAHKQKRLAAYRVA